MLCICKQGQELPLFVIQIVASWVGQAKIEGGRHLFKGEKNTSVPHIPLSKADTGSSDTAKAGFHGQEALRKGAFERRGTVVLYAGCGRKLCVSACSGLMCNF